MTNSTLSPLEPIAAADLAQRVQPGDRISVLVKGVVQRRQDSKELIVLEVMIVTPLGVWVRIGKTGMRYVQWTDVTMPW